MKALFITPMPPFPPVSGGRLQVFLRMKHLRRRGWKVHLLTFATEKECTHFEKFRGAVDSIDCVIPTPDPLKVRYLFSRSLLQEIYLHHDAFREKMADLARKYKIDIAIFEGLGVAQYIDVIPGVPSVLYEHNVEYELVEQIVTSIRRAPGKLLKGTLDQVLTKCWLYLFGKGEVSKVKKYELFSISRFDLVINCSERDALILKRESVNFNYKVLPWCLEIPPVKRMDHVMSENKETYSLLFVGSMDWEPNKDAVFWFVNEILPLIDGGRHRVRLQIAGSSQSPEISRLHDGRKIIIRGFVENLSDIMAETDIFVAPIRIGSGVNVKVIEAMSYGLPVVTTSKGAEGLEVKDGEHLVICDSARDFAAGIERLLDSANLRKEIGINGYRYVVARHNADLIVETFDEILRELCEKHACRDDKTQSVLNGHSPSKSC